MGLDQQQIVCSEISEPQVFERLYPDSVVYVFYTRPIKK